MCIFLFKRKTAYGMRISDWSSDVCSSDLHRTPVADHLQAGFEQAERERCVVTGERRRWRARSGADAPVTGRGVVYRVVEVGRRNDALRRRQLSTDPLPDRHVGKIGRALGRERM